MKKIDIHVHTRSVRGIPRIGTESTYCTPEELLAKYEDLGIERGVILPGVSPECCYIPQSMEDVQQIVGRFPGRFSWFCNVDPRALTNSPSADLSYFLSYYKERGARGVGEICANLPFDDPYVHNLFHHCEKSGMPVIFHIGPAVGGCYGLYDEPGLPRLERTLQAFPNLLFLGHSQPFWAEISQDVTPENRGGYPKGPVTPGRVVELLRKYQNLCCDLSAGSGYNALTRDPEFGCRFLTEFCDRLYFGTDICAPENDMKLSHWLDDAADAGHIPRETYEKICRGNAERLLDL